MVINSNWLKWMLDNFVIKDISKVFREEKYADQLVRMPNKALITVLKIASGRFGSIGVKEIVKKFDPAVAAEFESMLEEIAIKLKESKDDPALDPKDPKKKKEVEKVNNALDNIQGLEPTWRNRFMKRMYSLPPEHIGPAFMALGTLCNKESLRAIAQYNDDQWVKFVAFTLNPEIAKILEKKSKSWLPHVDIKEIFEMFLDYGSDFEDKVDEKTKSVEEKARLMKRANDLYAISTPKLDIKKEFFAPFRFLFGSWFRIILVILFFIALFGLSIMNYYMN